MGTNQVLLFQFLLLGCKLGPKFLHLFLQLGILLFGLFALGLYGFTLISQILRLRTDRLLLPLRLLQSLGSISSNLLSDDKITLHPLQFGVEFFTTARTMGDERFHSFSNLQPLKN